jgi:hypothetical protein
LVTQPCPRLLRVEAVARPAARGKPPDITGVRVQETAQVDAVAVSNSGDTIIAAYEDGTIREWSFKLASGPVSSTLIKDLGHRVEYVTQLPWGDVVLLGDGWLAQYVNVDGSWAEQTKFRVKSELRFLRLREDIIVLLKEEANQSARMLAIDPMSALIWRSIVVGGIANANKSAVYVRSCRLEIEAFSYSIRLLM